MTIENEDEVSKFADELGADGEPQGENEAAIPASPDEPEDDAASAGPDVTDGLTQAHEEPATPDSEILESPLSAEATHVIKGEDHSDASTDLAAASK
jgi:hypothetical protein